MKTKNHDIIYIDHIGLLAPKVNRNGNYYGNLAENMRKVLKLQQAYPKVEAVINERRVIPWSGYLLSYQS